MKIQFASLEPKNAKCHDHLEIRFHRPDNTQLWVKCRGYNLLPSGEHVVLGVYDTSERDGGHEQMTLPAGFKITHIEEW